MNATQLFRKTVDSIPADVKIQVELSFNIADKIAAILRERGMTQKDFAKKMGKKDSEVSKWLSGTHNFTLSTLAKISSVLEYNIIGVL